MNASLSAKGRGTKSLHSITVLFMRGIVFEQNGSVRYSVLKIKKVPLSKHLKGQNNKGEGMKQLLSEMHLLHFVLPDFFFFSVCKLYATVLK